MDPTEDLSARVLLRHILSTEPPKSPITQGASKTHTTNPPRRSSRRSDKDTGPRTPQDILRRSLRLKIHESTTRKSLPAKMRRTASVSLRRIDTLAPTSMLLDDGDTPRRILMNILQTEPVRSPVVHKRDESEDPQPSAASSSKRPSVELSGLDLPDLSIVNAASATKGLSRKRPRRSLNVTAFEKRLKDGDDVEEANEESDGDHPSLSLSNSSSLSLKTPFADVRTEKRGLQRRVSNRRKITEDEFSAAVNQRHIGEVCNTVERGTSETAYSEGFTLGFSKLSEPDITTDVIHCNTALYAQPDATTSSFSVLATQDKPTVLAAQLRTTEMEREPVMDTEHNEPMKEGSMHPFPKEVAEYFSPSQSEDDVDAAGSPKETGKSTADQPDGAAAMLKSEEEEEGTAECQRNVRDDTAKFDEQEDRVDVQTDVDIAADSQNEEEEDGAVDSPTEEDQDGEDDIQPEDAAAMSQSDEEEVAPDSQTEEDGAVDSPTEEGQESEVDLQPEDSAAMSQSDEEEVAPDSQTEEDGAVDSPTEEDQDGEDDIQPEDAAAMSQSDEEEVAPDSQTEEDGAVDSPTEEGQESEVDLQPEDAAAMSQSDEEEVAPDSQTEEDDGGGAVEELAAVDSQSEEEVEEVAERQTDQENSAEGSFADSQAEDEHDGEPEEEDDEHVSEQPERDLEHVDRRAHRSGSGVVPVMEAESGWSEGKSKAQSAIDAHDSQEMGSQSHFGMRGLAESSAQRRTDASREQSDADKGNTFNISVGGGGHDSPEEAAAQDPAAQEEEWENGEDGEESEEVPSKTPAFVREKRKLFLPNPLASPSLPKNVQASTSDRLPASKPKQRRKRTRPAAKEGGLPKSYLMKVFKHFAKTKVSADVYPVLKDVTDKFFVRLADDLETYALHAKRKTIEVEDVELLLKRQGYVNDKVPVEVLIEKYLRMDQRKLLIPIATSGNVVAPMSRR